MTGFKKTLVAAILTLGLAGCAEGPLLTWQPETDAERDMRLATERLQRAAGEGAAFGTLGGSLIGALTGGLQGALSGAEIGRFAGAGAGTYISSLQEQYATREEVLDQVLSDLKAANAEIEASIATMQRLLVERQGVLRTARAQADATKRNQEETRGERNLGEMRKAVEAAEGQVEFFGAARTALAQSNPAANSAINPQLALMQERIKAMKNIANTLAADL